jgi:hypothetical protein
LQPIAAQGFAAAQGLQGLQGIAPQGLQGLQPMEAQGLQGLAELAAQGIMLAAQGIEFWLICKGFAAAAAAAAEGFTLLSAKALLPVAIQAAAVVAMINFLMV